MKALCDKCNYYRHISYRKYNLCGDCNNRRLNKNALFKQRQNRYYSKRRK